MKRLFTSVCLVLAGMLAGWLIRDLAGDGLFPSAAERPASADVPASNNAPAAEPTRTDTAARLPSTVPGPAQLPSAARLGELLEQRDYGQSIAYYENALQTEESFAALLKPALEHHLGARVQKCADSDFIDLVDLWLEAYYADIEVLLLLAEHQRYCNSSEEAARTLQIASTYALRPGQRERVALAVSRLIAATEQRFSRNNEWIALLGFYEFLEVIELETNASQLQRAGLYARVGEVQRSRDLLLELQETDDGLDSEWTAALNQKLVNSAPQPDTDDSPQYEIPLTRRGNHYLVPAVINGVGQMALIIDTGASITTLSRKSFSRIESSGARYLGTQLFNTPNGITQGELYRVASIQLGDTEMRQLEIAVLDQLSSEGFDGLLGMNVLRNYRFNIDQDRAVLNMTPRR